MTLESLQQRVGFLQDFLEVYSSEGHNNIAQEGLESLIAEAAYAAEYVIESHVVDTILLQAPQQQSEVYRESSSDIFSHSLQKVIGSIDSIKKEVMMMVKEKTRVEDQKASDILVPVVLPIHPTTGKNIKVEYYEQDLHQILDKLTGQSSHLQVILIVGMGGIGKTTIATYIFENQLVVECFPYRAWVTVSQEYTLKDIFFGLLHQFGLSTDDKQERCEYQELGERLYKHLSGRKYLIIIDDMWSADVWEKIKLFLPKYNNNGSRVIITTRLLNVVDGFDSSHLHQMNLLDENKSWSLLCTKVFGHDGNCPPELEDIGKDIARNCKGLPLSIVVIGGLLAKSKRTQEHWRYVAIHINQIVNSEDDGRWLSILYLSYSQLPLHLKPCFLYMGYFKEDQNIRISELIKLWVAEGFLKPCKGKSLEEAANEYLKDLMDRNLVFVREWGSIGKMKTCGIHDLLRDLCLKEARKDGFLGVFKKLPLSVNNERRIIFHEGATVWNNNIINRNDFASFANAKPFVRSLSCDSVYPFLSLEMVQYNHRLSRVLCKVYSESLESILKLVNLRYLHHFLIGPNTRFPPMVCQLWFLQTLVIRGKGPCVAPYEIWEMPQLRHIIVYPCIILFEPLQGRIGRVLKNLQTLKKALLRLTESVVARIPNIKRLSIQCDASSIPNYNSLHNLDRLQYLQSLTCSTDFLGNLALLPQSLKKLTLIGCEFDWDSLTTKVGSLPNLEKLKLHNCSGGIEWNTVEGKFLHLKYLEINDYGSSPKLVWWTSESSHFPLLQHLVLIDMAALKKIPSGIGETLQSIELFHCRRSVIASAKEIVEEQESLGNEDIRFTIRESMRYIMEEMLWKKC